MNAEVPPDKNLLTTYLAAMRDIDDDLLALLDQVAIDNELSENETLALAILGTWSVAKDIEDGRIYISVPADTVRFYDRADRLLLGEASKDVAQVGARLRMFQREDGPFQAIDLDKWLLAKRALRHTNRKGSTGPADPTDKGEKWVH